MNNRNSVNLIHFIRFRESNIYPGVRHPVPSHFLYHGKNFYRSITPRLTVVNVNKPYGYLRKFTPDGRLLIAFSHDIKSIDVYEYQGVASVGELINHQECEVLESEDNSYVAQNIRARLFDRMFERQFHIPIITTQTITRHFLNREFSLFVDNGRYVILGSVAGGSIFANYMSYYHYSDIFDDTELYDYTLYLVDLKEGFVADALKFEHDFLVLSHNHSVSLYGRTMAIFSTYRQCIELFEVNVKNGQFERLFTINSYGNDLDRELIVTHLQDINYTFDPENSLPLTHIKQKVLVFMLRDIMRLDCLNEKKEKLEQFYKTFGEIERTVIWKMQLIDNEHLLLRLEHRPTQPPFEINVGTENNFKLYVFYNFAEQLIIRIFPQSSMELVEIVRNYSDQFRNVQPLQVPWHASSPSNNYIFRSSFDQAFNSYTGGLAAAIPRFNSTIPISSQSFSTSPYLDYSLFKYEDRYISALERPRLNSFDPIRFFDRKTGQLLYRVFLEDDLGTDNGDYEIVRNPKDLVSFIFHPYEPFFISVQKCLTTNIINFHMYNSSTKVMLQDFNCYDEPIE